MGYALPDCHPGTHIFLVLTAVSLQILTNLSNELGDHLSGVDGEGREGPNYSMTDGGLTVKQMWKAINGTVVACAVCGLAMVLVSWTADILSADAGWKPAVQAGVTLVLGVAAIWASTHYTLGKNPYGYKGWGDLFVFIFFGLVSVLGSFFVIAHTIDWEPYLILPAVGMGLLSVAVLNVNNIRDMASDEGIRKTTPLRIGLKRARWYQTFLVVAGAACFVAVNIDCLFLLPLFGWHLWGVWSRNGKRLDPMLPLLVVTTFLTSLLCAIAWFLELGVRAKYGC